jgi:hypothetical protein
MSAKLEKLVARANLRNAEHILPDTLELALDLVLGSH